MVAVAAPQMPLGLDPAATLAAATHWHGCCCHQGAGVLPLLLPRRIWARSPAAAALTPTRAAQARTALVILALVTSVLTELALVVVASTASP